MGQFGDWGPFMSPVSDEPEPEPEREWERKANPEPEPFTGSSVTWALEVSGPAPCPAGLRIKAQNHPYRIAFARDCGRRRRHMLRHAALGAPT
jgi:hypothetical protein